MFVAPAPTFSPVETAWLVSEGFIVDEDTAFWVDVPEGEHWEMTITRYDEDGHKLHLLLMRDWGFSSFRRHEAKGPKKHVLVQVVGFLHKIRNGDLA
jgi:hypothetical protein